MTRYISLKEAAQLELQGAAQRLAVARQSLVDFESEHGKSNPTSPDLSASLQRERAMLETEVDAAWRQFQHLSQNSG